MASLLDVRLTEILEHAASVDQLRARAQFLRCVFDALAGALRVGAKGEHSQELERALAQRERALTQREQARRGRSAQIDARRERLTPLVRDAQRKHPDKAEDAAGLATLLRRAPSFKARFKESRRTIEDDVRAIVKTGNADQSCQER
jgi:hypothetical protein